MALSLLLHALGLIGPAAMLLALLADAARESAVCSSYTKLKLTVITIISAAIAASFITIWGALNALAGYYRWAGVSALLAAYYLLIIKRALGDNDWFNGQVRRLKRGAKKLRSRLKRSQVASPLPSPA